MSGLREGASCGHRPLQGEALTRVPSTIPCGEVHRECLYLPPHSHLGRLAVSQERWGELAVVGGRQEGILAVQAL